MLRILNKIRKTGIVTEPLATERSLDELGIKLKRLVDRRMRGSFAIREVDAGSCNGCELEVHALNNPFYAIERFGVHFVASPRHADALLVTGPVSRHMAAALKRTYAATPAPKWVIAMGDCAVDGGEFGRCYATLGGVERVLPVDLVIPGCPPTPTALLRGVLALLQPQEGI
jgi:Ni,Fe-hydrogenase III small subunit